MPGKLLNWKIILVAVVAIFILVGVIHYTSQPRVQISWLEKAWRDVLAPFQTVVSRTQRFVRDGINAIQTKRQLQERNADLEALVLDLRRQVFDLRNYQRENEWLREALDFKSDVEHKLLLAEVIGRSPSNWENTIILNKGAAHGVTNGMAVVTNSGIVGTVINISRFTSTVLLIVDAQSAVGGMVQASGDLVLIEGMEGTGGLLEATPLSRDTEVEVGAVLVTSGLSRIYPKNLPLGEVISVEPRQYDLSFSALVRPYVDFTRLEYVLIVMPDE